MSHKPLVIVLHGPAAVGKDTLISELQRRTPIHRATSSTTRLPRPGERDGVDYHFLTREEFEAGIAEGRFIEWAEVYGDLKGLARSEVVEPLERGEDLIIRTDVQGARTWRGILEGAVSVFLMADDRETLRQRLIERNTESRESLERRLAEIDEELDDLPNNDYVVYNRHGQLAQAVEELLAIIARERADIGRPVPRLHALT